MYHFFAYMARMKQILRWGLMRNTRPENDQEHSLQAALISRELATAHNLRHGGALNADHIAVLAMYHDAGEVITGDLATPIKHFNPEVHGAFEKMEQMAREKLLNVRRTIFRARTRRSYPATEQRPRNGVSSKPPIKSARI